MANINLSNSQKASIAQEEVASKADRYHYGDEWEILHNATGVGWGRTQLICRIPSKSSAGISALPRRQAAPASSGTLPNGSQGGGENRDPLFQCFYLLCRLLKNKTAEKQNKSVHRWEYTL